MKNIGVLQARFSSSRLPGKVLLKVNSKPLLEVQIKRILQANNIDKLILATSVESSDDELEYLGRRLGIEVFRGSLSDVLDRFYQATQDYDFDNLVRLTGDCPLIDPDVIDKVIEKHILEGNDYTTNALEATYPDGLDVEVLKRDVFIECWKKATKKSEREHVTLYVNSKPERYKIGHVKNKEDLSYLRWTVDEPRDFELVKKILEHCEKLSFRMNDVLQFVRDNGLENYNTNIKRNEGLLKSLKEDLND
tara:strand:+ start:16890 stop:17639 length:750 start_codon:yes stop_codon:yes gene_type:complete